MIDDPEEEAWLQIEQRQELIKMNAAFLDHWRENKEERDEYEWFKAGWVAHLRSNKVLPNLLEASSNDQGDKA